MTASELPVLLCERAGGVLTLRLNRPQAMNALDGALCQALLRELDAAAADAQVRCVVLAGAGRAFCAGQDLRDPAVAPGGAPKDLGEVVASRYRPLVLRLRSMPVPTLAAVGGVAAGAGAALALMCDIVVARRSASFVQAFAAIALIPDSGSTWLLPRLAGRARALGLAMLGDKLPAAQAEAFGLIWKCVDDEGFEAEAAALAARLAAQPARALARTRALIDAGAACALEQALDAEAQAQRDLGFAGDYAEGVAAFAQKRAPRFTDR
ncbi:enoyl-CoA hydratase-related protein [Thiomonas sp. FB-6]|uniref:enoyl-CoA hydratase-related protein n=1 Tax=Thiomonas sp. FB-6 TaxID=1158291 RepID=UPI000379C44A|nr:enoyl-CoA hydratase-related protein [Thiomonas sp. FB-6]